MSRKAEKIGQMLDREKAYSLSEAMDLLGQCTSKAFTESVDVAVRLGVDATKSDQTVRGAVVMPSGTGKSARVAVFADGEEAEAALKAGADRVGMEDLLESVKAGELDYDVVIAVPKAMPLVGQVGQVLGPRGLMPNPKTNTVTPDPAQAVTSAKSGQVRFRADRNGIVHGRIGQMGFATEDIRSNIQALCAELKRLKPPSSKGTYIRKISLSTTMGPGVTLDLVDLNVQ